MNNKKTIFFVALGAMIVTALITSVILLNTSNSDDIDNPPVLSTTPTTTITVTNSPLTTDTVTPTAVVTTTLSPTPTYDTNNRVRSYSNSVEYYHLDGDGTDSTYLFTPSGCDSNGCDWYEVKESMVTRNDHDSLLSLARDAAGSLSCPEQPIHNLDYALLANDKVFEHAEPHDQTFYVLKDFDIFINGEFLGKDDMGMEYEQYTFLVYSKCSSARVIRISASNESEYPFLKSLEPGDTVSISGVLGGGGAAAGTTYFDVVSDLRLEIF